MKLFLLIVFFVSSFGWSQEVFKSPYTESWPNIFQSQIDEVNRSISIGHSEIVIITERENSKEVETFLVEAVEEKNFTLVFYCLTRRGKPAKVMIPTRNEIKFIDIFKPSEKTGEEQQLRFYVYY